MIADSNLNAGNRKHLGVFSLDSLRAVPPEGAKYAISSLNVDSYYWTSASSVPSEIENYRFVLMSQTFVLGKMAEHQFETILLWNHEGKCKRDCFSIQLNAAVYW